MTITAQIVLGTCLMAICALIHIVTVALSIPWFAHVSKVVHPKRNPALWTIAALSTGVVAISIAHTIQIWIWSFSLILLGAFSDLPASFYFTTVTYTTLGYGDIILDDDHRIFAAFASIAGLLTIGISTAFLIGIVIRSLPDAFGDHH